MIFAETKLEGAFIIEPEKFEDKRGFFATTWDRKIFEERKLNSNLVECNISFNKKRGTIRGMHYQITPYEQTKLVRCTRGKIFDVIIDLRSNSVTYLKWVEIELSSENYKMCYVPEGFAHGFQTLEDNSEVLYQMSKIYQPEYVRGIKWNDDAFNISWPLEPTIISKKDQSWEFFKNFNIL